MYHNPVITMSFFLWWKLVIKLTITKLCLPFLKVYSLPSICFTSHTTSQKWRFLGEFFNVISCMVPVFPKFFQCPAQALPSKHGPFWRSLAFGWTRAHFRTVRRSAMRPHTQHNHLLIQSWDLSSISCSSRRNLCSENLYLWLHGENHRKTIFSTTKL